MTPRIKHRRQKTHRKNTPPFLTRMITKIARRRGATVILEPEFGYVGQIIFKNGRRTFFRNRVLSINTASSMEVTRDKNYTAFFLQRFGYRMPRERTFFSDEWCTMLKNKRNLRSAYTFAKTLGFPVIVKPNNLSQGALVTKVWTRKELESAAKKILRRRQLFLVQEYMTGRDYRIVVLDGEVISAYERLPLCVTGTGKKTVWQLLQAKQRAFKTLGRDTQIDPEDYRIAWKLKSQGFTFRSVIPRGHEIPLLDNANLSTGGESKDVTRAMHRDYRRLAAAIAKDMSLRLCGVDIMTSDITQPLDPKYVVLEVNSSPGLDHYATSGREQSKIVESLYEKVLRAIEKQ